LPDTVAPALEAVYYGSPIPASLASLTSLAIVFDRIYFPYVRLPVDGYDLDEVAAEADRIEAVGHKDYDTALLIGILRALPHLPALNDFCTFTGATDQVFGAGPDAETGALVKAIEELVFGPPPPGFIPSYARGYSKGLPGNHESIDYPGFLFYPATALQYAAKTGLPIVNDNPNFPVPCMAGADVKNNAKVLASILAMECVNFALPAVRPLNPDEIVELRSELRPFLQPFRTNVLSCRKT
jgi:hypothetical protein